MSPSKILLTSEEYSDNIHKLAPTSLSIVIIFPFQTPQLEYGYCYLYFVVTKHIHFENIC